MLDQLAAVVVHYQTPDLLDRAVRSLKAFYPQLPVLLVDNGSQDASRQVIRTLAVDYGETLTPLLLNRNLFHGPAMDRALRLLEAEFVYVFDSDTETRRGGFLEPMLEAFDGDRVYGVGRVARVNKRGFASPVGTPILVSAYMMLRRAYYDRFPPFEHHGMPALKNFAAATAEGYALRDFPVAEYVHHLGRGTASRFGYSLGLRGRLDYVLNRLGL